MKTITTVFGVLALASAALAKDKQITESEVPRPVIERVKRKYPTAKMIAFEQEIENGAPSYEVRLADGPKQLEVVCSPNGRIIAEEEKIVIEVVPDPVRRSLRAHTKYGSWTIREVERVIFDEDTDSPSYELKLAKGAARAALIFSSDGKLMKTEEQAGHDGRK